MAIISKKCCIITSVSILVLAVIAGGLALGIILWQNAQVVRYKCQREVDENLRAYYTFKDVEITKQDNPYYQHFECDTAGYNYNDKIIFQNSSIYRLTENMLIDKYVFSINFTNCNLQEVAISYSDNYWSSTILSLDLSGNQVKVLQNGAFYNVNFNSLNLSNNKIHEIQKHFIGGRKKVQKIFLSNNRIKQLKEGFLSNFDNMSVLDLSYNLINEIEDYSLPKIQELFNISHNQLAKLTKHMLKSTEQAATIDYSFNQIESIPENAFNQHIKLAYLNFEGNIIKSLGNMAFMVPTFDENFKNYLNDRSNQILIVNLRNNHLTAIEDNIFSNKIQKLDLSANRIDTIGKRAFSQKCILNDLNLSENNLTVLTSGMFSYFNISSLTLDDNPLEVIEENSLPDLNKIINYYNDGRLYNDYNYNKKVFYKDDNTTTLKMNNTKLIKIEDGPFNNLHLINQPYLKNLNLRNVKSKNVYCEGNKIERLVVGSETLLIKAAHNQIQKVEAVSNGKLSFLDLSNNNITTIENIDQMPALKNLNLTRNPIKHLNYNKLKRFGNLIELILSYTNLQTIENDLFFQLPLLERLDISNNNLEYLNMEDFSGADNLVYLNIANNALTSIHYLQIRNVMPKVIEIDLRNNKWSCNWLKSMIKYLRSNNISHQHAHVDDLQQDTIFGVECLNNRNNDDDDILKQLNVTVTTPSSNVDDKSDYFKVIEALKSDIYEQNKQMLRNIREMAQHVEKSSNYCSTIAPEPKNEQNSSLDDTNMAIVALKDEMKTVNKQTVSILNELMEQFSEYRTEIVTPKDITDQIVIDEDTLKKILDPYFQKLWTIIYITCVFVIIAQIIMLSTVFCLTVCKQAKKNSSLMEPLVASRE